MGHHAMAVEAHTRMVLTGSIAGLEESDQEVSLLVLYFGAFGSSIIFILGRDENVLNILKELLGVRDLFET